MKSEFSDGAKAELGGLEFDGFGAVDRGASSLPGHYSKRVKGKLVLVVDHFEGRPHLPVVSLRQAA